MIKKDYFVPRMFYKLLIPSVISSIGFAMADMADALVLGQKVGETGLAAISLCLPFFMLINIFMDGLAIGGCVHFSQKLGEGNDKKAVECFNRIWISALIIALVIGLGVNLFIDDVLGLLGTNLADGELFYSCKDYIRIIAFGTPFLMLNIVFANFLRNDNNSTLATKGFLIGNAVDIVLNIVLVIFLGLGTKGAALSTVIGSAVAIIFYLPGIIGKNKEILKVRYVFLDLKEIFYCFKTGFSTSVQHLLQLVFLLVVNRILMSISGESGVAVFDVVYNVSFFLIYMYNGVSEASQPLISTFSGENSEEDCKYVLNLSKKYGIGFGLVVAVLLFVFAENISQIFGITDELLPLSVNAIRIYCFGFAFLGLNILYGNYYQSKENVKLAFFIVFMRGFVILLPSVLFFAVFGVEVIWLMFPVTELITLLLFYLFRMYNLRREPIFEAKRILRITVENESEDMEKVINKTMGFCEKWNGDAEQKYYVTLIIEEICMSIIRNAMTDIKNRKIRITLLAEEDGDFVLNLIDNAVVFNPFSFKSKKIDSDNEFNIDEISMMMIKKKTKKFMYRRCNGFNSLVVRI